MKKYLLLFLLLIFSNCVFSQYSNKIYISTERHTFNIVTGLSIIGVGLSIQPLILRTQSGPAYRYPEIAIPVSLGITLTMSGIIEGIKKEKKKIVNN
jgi:hypothetical protein